MRKVSDGILPPDPEVVAPPPDPGVVGDIGAGLAFLYAGFPPIQTGVSSNAIDDTRVVVVRGRVLERSGSPLLGVAVSVFGKPAFGQTLTRTDGRFDLAFNGGGTFTLLYRKAGYLPAHRAVEISWRESLELPDVVLLPLDTSAAEVVFGVSLRAKSPPDLRLKITRL